MGANLQTIIKGVVIAFAVSATANAQTTTTTTGTVTTQAPAAVASPLKFKVSSLLEVTREDLDKAKSSTAMMTTNYLGASYALNSKDTLGLRFNWQQGFYQDSPTNKETTVSTFKTLDPTIHYSTIVGSILGSKEVAPSVRYVIPVTDASKNSALLENTDDSVNEKNAAVPGNVVDALTKDGDALRSQSLGTLRLDAELSYDITPKYSTGYYLNPRYGMKSDTSNNTLTWIHYWTNSYAFTDKASVYGQVGQVVRTINLPGRGLSNSMTESVELAVGGNYNLKVGNQSILIMPEVSNSIVTKSASALVAKTGDFQLMRAEEITYSLLVEMSL